jgi:uncharacterized membrane protein
VIGERPGDTPETETAATVPAPEPGTDGSARTTGRSIQLGLFVSPVLDEDAIATLRDELAEALGERYPDFGWEVRPVRDRLVTPPVQLTDLLDATRSRLLADQHDLAVYVTELPLRLSRRPLLTHASPIHGVALVSLPALGVLGRRRRLRDAVADAIGTLVGDAPPTVAHPHRRVHGPLVRRRLDELAARIDDDPARQSVAFLARVITGNVRLLLGMIGANHPWRLVVHLSRALLGAFAAAVFGLVTFDVWRIADSLDPLRLTIVAVGSIAASVVTLIVAHELWESSPEPRAREQVALFNLATLGTVVIGIGTLYLAVFVMCLVGAALLIDSSLMATTLRHPVGASEYLRLAWLVSSLATAGGALGALLETDATVHEAAYARGPAEESGP